MHHFQPNIKPRPNDLVSFFWEGARKHEVLLQRCRACGYWWHPPAPICRRCRSFDYEWRASNGRGEIYSFVIVRHAVHPLVESWIPYNVALITLSEGPRIISSIRNCPEDSITIGQRVEVIFEDLEDFTLPLFQPAHWTEVGGSETRIGSR
jgi:uncharacterized protein